MIHCATILMLGVFLGAEGDSAAANRIEVPEMLIRSIEQIDVPAKEAGWLSEVVASEGQLVAQGDVLAQIADIEARLAMDRTKLALEIARKNGENDINVRYAKKSEAVAKAELQRALDSIAKYAKSISDTELDHLRLVAERATLEIEQAEREFEIAKVMQEMRENECRSAEEKVAQRRITAPLAGVVVRVDRHRGEWVEPGDPVLRILRIDCLRAEGFIKIQDTEFDLESRDVTFTVNLPGEPEAVFPGRVVFVSPEVDPVNAQVRIWAEIENRGKRLRPGMRAAMTIHVTSAEAATQ